MKNQTKIGPDPLKISRTDSARRRFIQNSAATVVVAITAPSLPLGRFSRPACRVVRIGFIGPRSGELAHFGEGNEFILPGVRELIADGIVINGTTHPV